MGMHRVGALACVSMLFLAIPAAAATITVPAGGNLQAAIDNAAGGDTLTIRSAAADSVLPASGQRTSPAYAPYLPKLKSPNGGAALTIEPGASYITVQHIEVLPAADGSSSLIELG